MIFKGDSTPRSLMVTY